MVWLFVEMGLFKETAVGCDDFLLAGSTEFGVKTSCLKDQHLERFDCIVMAPAVVVRRMDLKGRQLHAMFYCFGI